MLWPGTLTCPRLGRRNVTGWDRGTVWPWIPKYFGIVLECFGLGSWKLLGWNLLNYCDIICFGI